MPHVVLNCRTTNPSLSCPPFCTSVFGLPVCCSSGGVRNGLMRGYMSGLATYGPFSAIYFLTYERFKNLCLSRTSELGTGHFVVVCTVCMCICPLSLTLFSNALATHSRNAVQCTQTRTVYAYTICAYVYTKVYMYKVYMYMSIYTYTPCAHRLVCQR